MTRQRARRTVRVLFTVALTLHAYSPGSADAGGQGKSTSRATLFGVRLSEAGTRLLREVERAYGKSVVEMPPRAGAPPGEAGTALVREDGTPLICINPAVSRREEVIVHELFHLKLYAEGYHHIQYAAGSGLDRARLHGMAESLLVPWLDSQVQHNIFYPRMRRMGFDPAFDQREPLLEIFKSPPLMGEDLVFASRVWALLYFRAATQINDRVTRARVEEYYRRPELGQALELGKRLTSLYLKAVPLTPDGALRLTVEFCNILFDYLYQFHVTAVISQPRGTFPMPKAYIMVTPKRTVDLR